MHTTTASHSIPTIALLAGGLATRLRPVTETIPKSLIPVAGEPFIFHQLRLLVREGARDVVICAGYLGDQIKAAVGDGATFGCRVCYAFDGEKLLGTGGALRSALPLLGQHFMIMYGDSYLEISLHDVHKAFLNSGKPALMTVFHNQGKWDGSNIEFSNGTIRCYDKKKPTPAMQYIDYGLSVMDSSLLATRPANETFDLADLMHTLAAAGNLAGFEASNRFYEVGSVKGIKETDHYLRNKGNAL